MYLGQAIGGEDDQNTLDIKELILFLILGSGMCSMVESVPSVYQALGSTPRKGGGNLKQGIIQHVYNLSTWLKGHMGAGRRR